MLGRIWRSGTAGKLSIWGAGVVLLYLCLNLVNPDLRQSRLAARATTQPTGTTAPTDIPVFIATRPPARATNTPEPARTMAQNLAIINDTPNDQAVITRIDTLLTELDTLYPENEQEIGDLTAQSHAVLIEQGKPVDMITIMEQMATIGSAEVKGLTYKDSIIGWMLTYTGQ